MNATGTWVVPAHALEGGLGQLRQWRQDTADSVAAFRRWALVARVLDEQTALRLAHFERRLVSERLTIAFVGEFSRGKSELVNALFFANLGTRLLPTGVGRTTLCPVEILWDPALPPGIRLLPIETRESPRALREHLADASAWTSVAFDPAQPETLAPACECIAQTMVATAADAAALGLPVESDGPVEIPRWRYAIVNLPHALLAAGLVVLDTPGHNTLGMEPEITIHRIPDAAAVVFMLSADTGVTRTDRELWSEHIETVEGLDQSCYVVLNKIDGLRDGFKPETQLLAEIDKQVRSTAEMLHMPASRVFAVSARQGLLAKIQDDRDGQIRSRLYRLEQALARGMVEDRKAAHMAAGRAEVRAALRESHGLIASRLAFTQDQLEEINALQDRNQKLVDALARKAHSERQRLEQARAIFVAFRTVQGRHLDALATLLDPNVVREAGVRTRLAVTGSAFSSGIGEALDTFFRDARTRLRDAIEIIVEARGLMGTVSHKFNTEYKVSAIEVPDFATDRFLVEVDRLEQLCSRDFKGAGSLLTRRRTTLAALFFDSVALKVVHVFEIADREVRTWINGYIRPMDTQLGAFQEQANSRIEGMGRIQNAEGGLLERLGELRRLSDEVAAQQSQWQAFHVRLMSLLDGGS